MVTESLVLRDKCLYASKPVKKQMKLSESESTWD